jgi:hypothetical protein
MGRALTDGANGIAPADTRGPARAAPVTQATSVLSRGSRREPSPARGAVAPRQPRRGPAREAAAVPARAAAAPRRRGRGRLLGLLLGLLALALVIVAIVLITAPSPTRVVLRNVVYSDVQQAASALKQLVSENTK